MGQLIRSVFLSSPHVNPITDALSNPGLVDVIHRERGDLESPPDSGLKVGWRDASQMLFVLAAYLPAGVWASPG